MSLQQRELLAYWVALARAQSAGAGSDFSITLSYGSWGSQGPARRQDEAKLFSEVHRNRTRCSRHKLECGKSQLDVGEKKGFPMKM